MAKYKGIEVKDSVRQLLPHMPLIEEYREMLQSLQAVWDNLNLLGQLSGTTAEIGQTREAFASLTAICSTTSPNRRWPSANRR